MDKSMIHMQQFKRLKKSLVFGITLLILSKYSLGQTVATLPVRGLNGPNGFAIDKGGRLYIANEPGKQVIKVLNDSITELVISCDSPDGLAFDDAGNLYISNFYSGIILRKSDHSVDTFARGLDKPADIKWDGKGNLYVAEYEKGNIKKISPNGEITEFSTGFKHPFGLAFDKDENLYVANNGTGVINRISPSGVITLFTQIPGAISYITYSKKTGRLYATCFSCHNIYSITNDGKAELLAGNGSAGYKDGSLKGAQFNGPNSIAISIDGNLYISEFPVNRIRKITKVEN
jgi:DNA-binding beta-propeller fold protein YncE